MKLSQIKKKNEIFNKSRIIVIFLFSLTTTIIVVNTTYQNNLLALKESNQGILGGSQTLIQNEVNPSLIFSSSFAFAANQNSNPYWNNSYKEEDFCYLIDNNSLQNPNSLLINIHNSENGIITYKVQKGDTLRSIANDFGISLDTIRWANNLKNDRVLPGKELIILPVSGILYEIKAGDNLEKIAQTFSASVEKIISFNKLSKDNLIPGQKIIIPDGQMPKSYRPNDSYNSLPFYPYYYILPTTGFNWGILHNINAVDIANHCDTPVIASAEGLVETVAYDNGYGRYIKIQHPNNTQTLYAHLNKVVVNEGEYVIQGQLIGLMGNTGYVIGNPGCHLHFEVRGAKNPFVKY